MKRIGRVYVADSILRPEDLVSMDKELVRPDIDALISRQVLGARTGDHAGTEVITYRTLTREGAAKIFNHVGADNVPLVDGFTTLRSQNVRSIVIGFQVSKQERRAADMSGIDVGGEKLADGKLYIASKENDIFFNGASAWGITGVLGLTGAQTYSAPNGAGGSATWALKTASEVLADVRTVWGMVHLQDNYQCTMAVMNTGTSVHLHQPLGTNADRTVIEHIRAQGWFPAGIITSESIPAGTFMVLDNRTRTGTYALPLDVERGDPYLVNGFTVEVDLEERYGGPCVKKPLGVCVMTGIA